MNENQYLHDLRHSAAHLLAHAVLQLFPGTKPTIGPVTEHGFFYDFLPVKNFKEEDLEIIEQRMRELAKQNFPIAGGQIPKAVARDFYTKNQNQFKLELIDGIEGETVGFYTQGDFSDLCRGGHLAATGEVKFFKLMTISGSYWRADRNGILLQRISGVAFETQEALDAYLKRLEDIKAFNHRHIGKQMDLFSFHDEAPGMVFFHDKGLKIYNRLIAYSRKLKQNDFQEIKTPLVLHESIFKTSGHYDHYRENAYITSIDESNYWLRPMNCPCSFLVYKTKPRSYRELPLRLSEYGLVHRHELSGTLHGLFRVRSFTQDDSHTFCTIDGLIDEVEKELKLADTMYKRFNFAKVNYKVSTRPDKSMGSDEMWKKATNALMESLKNLSVNYTIEPGEGAFYGPKIGIYIEDAMGREWQCGTVQIDFNAAVNFDIEYIQADQSRTRPVVIHLAIYGSIERFLGILLEHYKGRLPFWLAPVQIRILPITEKQNEYALRLQEQLRAHDIFVEIDDSNDKISAKIRLAQVEQIPLMLVVGDKEATSQTVALRYVTGEQELGCTYERILEITKKLTT